MSAHLKTIHTHALDFWFARSSVVVIGALQLLIINKLSLGPRWLAPALEFALLAPLSFATAWTQGLARDALKLAHGFRGFATPRAAWCLPILEAHRAPQRA